MRSRAISIVYATGREEPAFEWFVDGLARQVAERDEVDIVMVDAFHDDARTARFTAAIAERFPFRHVPPKPTPYQGPHRRTAVDCFAAASARNTGLVYARAPYVVFADDCAVPMPTWWQAVRRAAQAGDVVAGAYQKRWDMRVVDGVMIESRLEPSGIDSRWALGNDKRPVRIAGGQLYGASFGVPRELLMSINGLDEICDLIGGEDYQLGMRLAYAGARIVYDRRMFTVESEELSRAGKVYARRGRELSPDAYAERLAAFGVGQRSTAGAFDNSHMVLDIVYGTESWASHGNYYWLADLTPDGLADTVRRFPAAYWFDGCAYADL
jgi:hypothetical protein